MVRKSGVSGQHMKDLRAAARSAVGKGAGVRRSAALELMAHGGPMGGPRVAADLCTVRGFLGRSPEQGKGGGRGPIRNLTVLVGLLLLKVGVKEISTSLANGLMLTTKSIGSLRCTSDFQGLDSGLGRLATQTLRQLKLDGESQKDNVKTALNAALGGVWHEARVHAKFGVGDLCVRFGEAVADLEHIVHHCPAWSLVSRHGAHIVWINGSGRHSNNPHFRRCGVGYYTDTGVWLALPRLKQSVNHAELLATVTVRALEKCKPTRLVSDCKGVVSCLHALRAGRRQRKGRHRDLESGALAGVSNRVDEKPIK
eukprot:3490676-Amphidinium_carterae.1